MKKIYFIYVVVFFIIELGFIYLDTNAFFRSYATDVFAVLYLYFLTKLVSNFDAFKTAAIVCIISYTIESIQYFNLFENIDNIFLTLIVGKTFDIFDLVAYNIGIAAALIIEYCHSQKKTLLIK